MNPSVLVVDDDRLFLRLVELNLEKLGITVKLAESGLEALRLALSERPDVILLDLMMPQMDGYEVLRRLKSSEETREIPIVMLTAKSSHDDRIRCEEIGIAGYITKPFRIEALCNTVMAIVEEQAES